MGFNAIRSRTLCLYFVIFVAVIAQVQGTSTNTTNATLVVQNRIINGIATKKGRYPYVVQIYETRGRGDFLCGGILIGMFIRVDWLVDLFQHTF
jgi:secreted trypsin-like serine protease